MDEKFKNNFPYEMEPMDSQENKIPDLYNGLFGYYGPKKFLLPKGYAVEAGDIYNFKLRTDDTFVVTFPKTGTTMTQELVWLVANNLDYEKAASTVLTKRFPYIEYTAVNAARLNQISLPEEQIQGLKDSLMWDTFNEINKLPSPRFIKSHLSLSLLPPLLLDTAKVVYVARDPRDVAVSYYHHHVLLKRTESDLDFDTFWKHFTSGNVLYGPYFSHVEEAWKNRKHPNMLFLFYEDIVEDKPSAIRRVADFFGKTMSNDQVSTLANHLDFNNFKDNKAVNFDQLRQCGFLNKDGKFMRKGKAGGWREYFDEEKAAQAEDWIKSKCGNSMSEFYYKYCSKK